METFGQRIKRLRKARRITQTKLAKLVGVDFTYISKIENDRGSTPPAELTIRKLAMFLYTDAEELLLLAKKIPQNLQETILDDKLVADFLRVAPKLNETQRGIVETIIKQAEEKF